MTKAAIRRNVKNAGRTLTWLARELRVSKQAVSGWKRIPVQHVLMVERLTGWPRHQQRPDIYPPTGGRD
jgi:DNA-binding transcriptional regulator YdaS (Cro superfamily)